ncbi:MAG: hypothetical protein CMF70_08135 [Magnetovibrio sp.]|nr:hypothetical protein [Magnetovibrio sp.]|tara:strand:+ start:1053 stop:1316 length:264 start_codon:yes stop_codon:yes gene_type:complete
MTLRYIPPKKTDLFDIVKIRTELFNQPLPSKGFSEIDALGTILLRGMQANRKKYTKNIIIQFPKIASLFFYLSVLLLKIVKLNNQRS